MRSSDGSYFERLDHLRGLAVFMVFFWHFIHGSASAPLLPFGFVPPAIVFPASLLVEGHAGVSLFMVLSGYLFARLIGSKRILYGAFLRNRALRLLPLLSLVIAIEIVGGRESAYSLVMGFIRDGWSAPGTWSVMVEMQFYVLLPLLLALTRRTPFESLLALIVAAIALRALLWDAGIDVKDLATYSLVGRIDNFAAGLLLAHIERRAGAARHQRAAALLFGLFVVLYYAFNVFGGFKVVHTSSIWIVLPTIESVGFAALIYLYCGLRSDWPRSVSRAFAKVGEASYSIYLLHFTVIAICLSLMVPLHLAQWSAGSLTMLSIPVFILCFAVGHVSYAFIERPFLQLRVPYLRSVERGPMAATADGLRTSAWDKGASTT